MEYVLYHDGIPGMKWGVRRFQNLDGTLTEAGKERYRKGSNKGKKYSNKQYNSMNKIAKEGKIITDETGKIIDKFGTKTKKTTDVDPSTLTDEELRQIINRLNMEEQYARLTTKNETSKGAQVVKDILSFAGSALVVAGSVTAIMANMKTIKDNK